MGKRLVQGTSTIGEAGILREIPGRPLIPDSRGNYNC